MKCYMCGKKLNEATAQEGIDYWRCLDGKSIICMQCFEGENDRKIKIQH